MDEHIDPRQLIEVIQSVVRELLPHLIDMPESATFSGSVDDVIIEDRAIYLRLSRTRVRDSEGIPHTAIARLCGASGLFSIPNVETEVLFVPIAGSSAQGSGWCFLGAQLPEGVVLGNITAGRAVLAGPTGKSKISFSADGTLTIESQDSVERSVYVQVGPAGILERSPWGAKTTNERGYHVVDASGARLDMGGMSGVSIGGISISSYAKLRANDVHVSGGVLTRLGPGPWFNIVCGVAPGAPGISGACIGSVQAGP